LAASTVLLAAVELSTVSDGKLFGSVSPATRVPGSVPLLSRMVTVMLPDTVWPSRTPTVASLYPLVLLPVVNFIATLALSWLSETGLPVLLTSAVAGGSSLSRTVMVTAPVPVRRARVTGWGRGR